MQNKTIRVETGRCIFGVAVLSACLLACGCRMVSNVESASDALEQSSVDLLTISETITNTVPVLEEASRTLQGASTTIATITPAIDDAKNSLEKATVSIEHSTESLVAADRAIQVSEGSIDSSTKSIEGITVAVDDATTAIEQLCLTLDTFQGGLDRLSAQQGLLWIGLVVAVLLALTPPVVVFILLLKFNRRNRPE